MEGETRKERGEGLSVVPLEKEEERENSEEVGRRRHRQPIDQFVQLFQNPHFLFLLFLPLLHFLLFLRFRLQWYVFRP
jgi:hypothetical protein